MNIEKNQIKSTCYIFYVKVLVFHIWIPASLSLGSTCMCLPDIKQKKTIFLNHIFPNPKNTQKNWEVHWEQTSVMEYFLHKKFSWYSLEHCKKVWKNWTQVFIHYTIFIGSISSGILIAKKKILQLPIWLLKTVQ